MLNTLQNAFYYVHDNRSTHADVLLKNLYLFETVNIHTILDFIKEIGFYNRI